MTSTDLHWFLSVTAALTFFVISFSYVFYDSFQKRCSWSTSSSISVNLPFCDCCCPSIGFHHMFVSIFLLCSRRNTFRTFVLWHTSSFLTLSDQGVFSVLLGLRVSNAPVRFLSVLSVVHDSLLYTYYASEFFWSQDSQCLTVKTYIYFIHDHVGPVIDSIFPEPVKSRLSPPWYSLLSTRHRIFVCI